jgi:hypothetical protein
MRLLREFPQKIKKLIIELKNLGRIDKLFLYRRLLVSFYNWVLSPFVLNRFIPEVALPTMFCYLTIVTFVFLKLTNHENGKSSLLKFVYRVCLNKKVLILLVLFIFDPFLFAVYFKNNFFKNHKYKWILQVLKIVTTLLSLIISTIIWTVFVNVTGLKI